MTREVSVFGQFSNLYFLFGTRRVFICLKQNFFLKRSFLSSIFLVKLSVDHIQTRYEFSKKGFLTFFWQGEDDIQDKTPKRISQKEKRKKLSKKKKRKTAFSFIRANNKYLS